MTTVNNVSGQDTSCDAIDEVNDRWLTSLAGARSVRQIERLFTRARAGAAGSGGARGSRNGKTARPEQAREAPIRRGFTQSLPNSGGRGAFAFTGLHYLSVRWGPLWVRCRKLSRTPFVWRTTYQPVQHRKGLPRVRLIPRR